ncbi:hypothetical protein [Anaeromyxobacter paludicola]|uniref:Bacterial virulence factor lipase N-terminal domain-containing protein n=1 Tax=Anaeromyxobacter paludicola TaxID=2918171 RepID=A0ABN6N913_9BACT|nr:hypothetical protein [Anaeromyxobacter paludicola]BDG09728.1 hypothetical protein AMPC_28410 [Anaeromyxobacter paludicola]
MLSLRRYTPTLAVLGLLAACTPDVNQHANPANVTYAAFDPSASPPAIPLPNDLARANVAATSGAQKELLTAFNQAGGFPNDQEVAVTVDFFTEAVTVAPRARTAPDLDLTTFKAAPGAGATLAVFQVAQGCPFGAEAAQGKTCQPILDQNGNQIALPVAIETLSAGNYVKLADHGTLSIYPKKNTTTGARRWPAGGKFVVAIRGGASGVKTKDGKDIQPEAAMYLLLQDKNLADPANQALLALKYPDPKTAAAFGQQLEAVREPLVPAFQLMDQVGIPHRELAVITGFTIAPAAGAVVLADPTAGQMPLPSDFLIDPATNRIVNNPAFCGGNVDASGSCPTAAGLATLDGFSTTAMILAQTSGPIRANTVNSASVQLFDFSTPSAPARLYDLVDELTTGGAHKAQYVSEPPPITQEGTTTSACAPGPSGYDDACVSTAIGLQPAIPAQPPLLIHSVPPLKEGTEYLVVVTNKVKDANGTPLVPSTLGKILQFKNPVSVSGKSQLPGVSDAQAAGIEQIRLATQAGVAAAGIDPTTVVMAYTFRTQGITHPALQLAAVPYSSTVAPLMVPGALTAAALPPGVPSANVAEVFSAKMPTLNPIDATTGALNPDNTKWTPGSLNALVVVPAILGATSCTASPGACAKLPLVVFQHGLGQNKTNVFAIASALSTAGFVTVAIDAPLHGERAFCAADADCACAPGVTSCGTPKCTLPASGLNKLYPTGTCGTGQVATSGKYFVTANFFATRDALREDILDHSALIAALAPLSAAAANPVSTELATKGVAIDPTKVYWVGQSLGGILGTLNTAVDPRISKAVLNVPGGTLVDVFTNSPTFQPQLAPIFASIGVTVGTPQYLQALQLAKWILDGADPINFAGHLTGDATHPTLANPLSATGAAQSGKAIYGQYAICDQVITNPFEAFLFEQAGVTPGGANPLTVYTVAGAGTPGACTPPSSDPATNNPAHGFLLNGVDPTATANGQSDAAGWLAGLLTTPPATH